MIVHCKLVQIWTFLCENVLMRKSGIIESTEMQSLITIIIILTEIITEVINIITEIIIIIMRKSSKDKWAAMPSLFLSSSQTLLRQLHPAFIRFSTRFLKPSLILFEQVLKIIYHLLRWSPQKSIEMTEIILVGSQLPSFTRYAVKTFWSGYFLLLEESKTFADNCSKGDRTCADDYILLPHLSCALQSLYFYFSSLIPTLRLKCHILKAHKSPLIGWEHIILKSTYHLFWDTLGLNLKSKTEYHTDLEDALGSKISI